MTSSSNKGQIPDNGKGFTYTPNVHDHNSWVPQFNQLMEKGAFNSRNALISHLLEEGLRLYKGDVLNVPVEGLSQDEVNLLNSEQGQTILKNMALMMLGKGDPYGLQQTNLKPAEPNHESPVKEKAITQGTPEPSNVEDERAVPSMTTSQTSDSKVDEQNDDDHHNDLLPKRLGSRLRSIKQGKQDMTERN